MNEKDPTELTDIIVRSLRARLGEGFGIDVLRGGRGEVRRELAAYSSARVTQFVRILVESRVRTRLMGLGQRSGVHERAR